MLSGIKRETLILVAYATVTSFGVSMVSPYIPIHAKEMGIPISIIGYMVVVYYLLQTLTRIPLGKLSDLIGHHRPVFLGAICYSISSMSFILSTQIWPLLFIGQSFLGLANSITWVTIPSYITQNKKAVPVYTFSIGFGWLIGSPVGGYIKDNLGMGWLFIALMLASVTLLILSLLFYHESQDSSIRQSVISFLKLSKFAPTSLPIYPSMKSYGQAWKLLKNNQNLLIASLFSFLVFMTFGLGSSILPLYYTEIGLSSFLIGILISTRVSTSTLIRLISSSVSAKFGGVRILVISTVCVGVSMILTALTDSYALITLLSITWGLGSGFYLPIVFNIIGESTNSEERGVAMGVRGTLGTFGAAFSTLVFSNIAQNVNLSFSLLLAGAFAALGSIALGFFRKKQREESEPSVRPKVGSRRGILKDRHNKPPN